MTSGHPTPRSAGVTCAAALSFCGSLFALYVWSGIYFGIVQSSPDSRGHHLYDLHPLAFAVIVAVPVFLIVCGMCLGVGLFQLRAWARRAALIWATVALLFCLGMIAFRPFQTFVIPENFVGETESFKQLLAIMAIVLLLPVSVWWLFFFRLASVKRQFDPNAGPEDSGS